MHDEDFYKILQVDPEADPEVIQVAYRRLAQKFHPDVAGGAEAGERMKAINRAWAVLGDPARRGAYDRTRDGRGVAASPSASRSTERPATDPGASPAPRADPGLRRPPSRDAVAAPVPPGNPSGSVLTFSRYVGWSLGEIARTDPEFLEWLDRMTIGRPYREELDVLLRRLGRRGPSAAGDPQRGIPRH